MSDSSCKWIACKLLTNFVAVLGYQGSACIILMLYAISRVFLVLIVMFVSTAYTGD